MGRWKEKTIMHENGPHGPLAKSDAAKFESMKAEYVEIERTSWRRKAEILKEIRDGRYYRETHDTFDKFCHDVFDLTRQHANRLVASLATARIVAQTKSEPNGTHVFQTQPKLTSELSLRHILELQKLPSSQLRIATKKLENRGKITHKDVQNAVKETKREAKAEKQSKVTGRAATAMKAAEEILRYCRAIKTACTGLVNLLVGTIGENMPAGQPLDQIKKIVEAIDAGSPYSDCVYCESKNTKCKACKGREWLTRTEFHAAPSELRAKSKVHVKEEE